MRFLAAFLDAVLDFGPKVPLAELVDLLESLRLRHVDVVLQLGLSGR